MSQLLSPSHTQPQTFPTTSVGREAVAYQYLDERLNVLWHSSVPKTDDQAIDYFTFVADIGPAFHPKYIAAKRPGSLRYDVLPVWYEEETDEVWDL